MKEILDGLTSVDPDGWTTGACAGGDAALIAAYGAQGCLATDGDGVHLVGTVAQGYGTPSLGLSAGWIAATSDVDALEGHGLCFGGSASVGEGVICGSIQFSEGDQLWHATGATSVFIGATLDTSAIAPGTEVHAVRRDLVSDNHLLRLVQALDVVLMSATGPGTKRWFVIQWWDTLTMRLSRRSGLAIAVAVVAMIVALLALVNRDLDQEPTSTTTPAEWRIRPTAGGPTISFEFDQDTGWTRMTDSRAAGEELFFHNGRVLLAANLEPFGLPEASFLSVPIDALL